MLHQNNRCLTRYMDENLAPKTTAGKIALSPLAIPAGAVALAVDGVVINPVASIPGAFENASFVFNDIGFTGPFEIIVFPMRVATFPVAFVVSEILQCMIPLDW